MRKYYIANIIFSFLLFNIFFTGIHHNQFLLLHDHYIELSAGDNLVNLFIIRPVDFGISNSINLVSNFWDKLIYHFLFKFNFSTVITQRLLTLIILNLSLLLPFIGFNNIVRIFNLNIPKSTIYVISLFYSFNTYTLIFWNTGILMSLTQASAYYLVPLTFHAFYMAIFYDKSDINDKIKFCLLLFITFFSLISFITFVFFLVFFTAIYLILNHTLFKRSFFNVLSVALLYLPLLAVLLIIPYEQMINPMVSVNSNQIASGGMYTALQGGLLYQLLMWFWWPIYTYWEPRSILTFHEYLKQPISLIAPFLLYGLIIFAFIKYKIRDHYSLVFLSVFLILLIFVKGAQEPFGQLYLLLLKYMPLSSVFRTPDNKFALGIIFSISCLLILIANRYKSIFIIPILLSVITIQCYPLFTGVAIRGENTKVSADRIVSVSKDYEELISYINHHDEPYGYILSIPPFDWGFFQHDRSGMESHIGQDMLPKLSNLPFVYLNSTGGMLKSVYDDLTAILQNKSLELINKYPIKYILIRKDVKDNTFPSLNSADIPANFVKSFTNSLFTLYLNPSFSSIIFRDDSFLKMQSPVKYSITLMNFKKSQRLVFGQSYQHGWKLYLEQPRNTTGRNDLKKEMKDEFINFDNLSYLWRKPIFNDTHALYSQYANSWTIEQKYLEDNYPTQYFKKNADGSMDLELTLYFAPQSYFYLGLLISVVTALSYFLVFVATRRHSRLQIGDK